MSSWAILPTTCCAGPCRMLYCSLLLYCNNDNIRVINQQVRDFVKDCYNRGGGRSSRPKGKLIVKSEAWWWLLYSWVYTARGPDLQNILRQSYNYLTTMPKLRSTYDGRLKFTKHPTKGARLFLATIHLQSCKIV